MKPTHSFDREEVMAYTDGALSPERAAAVEHHLASCDACGALLTDLRGVSERLAAWQIEASPVRLASLIGRVSAAAETTAPAARSWNVFGRRAASVRRWALVGVPMAAVVVLLVVLPFGMRSRQSTEQAGKASAGAAIEAREFRPTLPAPQISADRPATMPMLRRVFPSEAQRDAAQPPRTGPMIVRTANIRLSTDAFDTMRAQVERLATAHAGRIGSIEISGEPASGRSLNATLRIPTARFDAALTAIRQLGKVSSESQGSEEITDAYRNLTVRIANGRREEQRLVELLTKRTGDLADVLAVEQALARVRGEVEEMESVERTMIGRVDEATVVLHVSENYRADLGLGPVSLGTRFHNALVVGLQDAADTAIALVIWLIEVGPTLLLWLLVLAWPLWRMWRRLRLALGQ